MLTYFNILFKALNGNRKLSTTTSLSIPVADDEMIDITPRGDSSYSSTTMAGNDNYGNRQTSPAHSAYARDRDLNDAEGECTNDFILTFIFK